MTRPQMIRADTIDLQDHESPSAQDHSRQPNRPGPLGAGPPSPHQAGALKRAEEGSAGEQQRSPRVSWGDGEPRMAEIQSLENGAGTAADKSRDGPDDREGADARQNGGLSASPADDSDMADAEGDDGLDDDMMDKISSSPSIDDEDIDFEFVYALHTFVATVEGQANATKGDTMVLLDDSNSYWWLVRVVKDSSIGYLPAEHIETPTERLARLNKHRNIDLSATMLGDNPEKSKNPLKKAMRRRNAKTVQFSAPTYYEASDVDYSTEEEEEGEEAPGTGDEAAEQQNGSTFEDDDEITTVEPLRPRAQDKEAKADSPTATEASQDVKEAETGEGAEDQRTSDEIFEGKGDGVHKSRNGTVRNTDSFFKDDSVETRKITLTPNLLRDDSSTSTVRSVESKELKTRASLETLEKAATAPEKNKDELKKKKDKKPGMLSGLFKRKDKKSKNAEDDLDDEQFAQKLSEESSRRSSPVSKASEEMSRSEMQPSPSGSEKSQALPQKQAAKLQKSSPGSLSGARDAKASQANGSQDKTAQTVPAPDRPAPTVTPNGATMRVVEREEDQKGDKPSPLQVRSSEESPEQAADTGLRKDAKESGGKASLISNMLKPSTSLSKGKPEKVKKAKQRVELDDFDSSPDAEDAREDSGREKPVVQEAEATRQADRLSESPIEVSPLDGRHLRIPPPLVVDSSSQEEASVSPVSPPSSPEMVDAPEVHESKGGSGDDDDAHNDRTVASSTATPTWSDASLRMYLEEDNDIRDLLIVVHDKSGVEPAGPDHPFVGRLFKEENARLADLTSRLDGLLTDWMARKSPSTR